MDYQEIIGEIRKRLVLQGKEINDDSAMEVIEDYVLNSKELCMELPKGKHKLISRIFYSLRRELDILQPYIENEKVSEIMVNGPNDIYIEISGNIEKLDLRFDSVEQLEELIRRIAAKVHREINELNPVVDARLEDGSRVNAVYKNIALNGPILTIRKFPQKAITMENLIETGSITREAAAFLEMLVKAGYNCFINWFR